MGHGCPASALLAPLIYFSLIERVKNVRNAEETAGGGLRPLGIRIWILSLDGSLQAAAEPHGGLSFLVPPPPKSPPPPPW